MKAKGRLPTVLALDPRCEIAGVLHCVTRRHNCMHLVTICQATGSNFFTTKQCKCYNKVKKTTKNSESLTGGHRPHLREIPGVLFYEKDGKQMAKIYTKAEKTELDRQLASMTDDQLRALELAGGRLLKKGAKHKYDQAEYNRRYRRRIALAALNKGMIQDNEL